MRQAKPAKQNPKVLAQLIIDNFEDLDFIESVTIAGPGFINFRLTAQANFAVIKQVLVAQANYGHTDIGAGKRVNVEFVSANPTGPLHVGHGRGARMSEVRSGCVMSVLNPSIKMLIPFLLFVFLKHLLD